MTAVDRWLLPDGVDEVLPPEAEKMEQVRRLLLDLYGRWGYELVIPPIVEFLESLLTGSGNDVDLQTFKIIDQQSGRTLGLRADITPQVARIDAHSLLRKGPTRLCYAETVVHAQANNMLASRIPVRVGAELFGHEGRDSDVEIVSLMIDGLKSLEFEEILLEIGDVSIYRSLIADTGISDEEEKRLFSAIQRKADADIDAIVAGLAISSERAAVIKLLPQLSGGKEILAVCEKEMGSIAGIKESVDRLAVLAEVLALRFPEIELYFDLSELRGYNYHTGIVFAAYLPGHGQVAKGGRYDRIGEVFGRPRPATGFDMDLKVVSRLTPLTQATVRTVYVQDQTRLSDVEQKALWQKAQQLRSQGYQVIFELQGQDAIERQDLTTRLVLSNGEWVLEDIQS